MKKYILLLSISVFALSIQSCGGDDDECTAESWAGVWSGTTSCAGTNLDLTFNITAVDENTIRIEYDSESDEVDIDGCNVVYNFDLDFLGNAIGFEFAMILDGDQIDVNVVVMALGVTESCDTVLSR